MEKIILAGIAVWMGFILSDGFPPVFFEYHQIYKSTSKSVKQTDKPEYIGLSYVVKKMDPH